MAITNSDPRTNPRAIVEQLKRFVQYADAPPTGSEGRKYYILVKDLHFSQWIFIIRCRVRVAFPERTIAWRLTEEYALLPGVHLETPEWIGIARYIIMFTRVCSQILKVENNSFSGKVVIVLQGIVNTTQGSGSKLSNLISRTNSSTSRKRKAAVIF